MLQKMGNPENTVTILPLLWESPCFGIYVISSPSLPQQPLHTGTHHDSSGMANDEALQASSSKVKLCLLGWSVNLSWRMLSDRWKKSLYFTSIPVYIDILLFVSDLLILLLSGPREHSQTTDHFSSICLHSYLSDISSPPPSEWPVISTHLF